MRRNDAVRARRLTDTGLSLAELLVTIMIFAIVLTVVTGTFVSLTRVTGQAAATDANVHDASNGMNEIARQIRGAVNNPVPNASDAAAFSAATTESMTFSTAVNQTGSSTQPQLVTFALATDRSLTETKTAAVAYQTTYWQFTGTVINRTLTGPVSAASASIPVLFQYFDSTGASLTPGAAGSLSAAQLGQIASVKVSLSIKSTKAGDTGVTLINTVGTPNLTATGSVS